MFSEYTGYYFYSSLLQAQAAIFSIFGVFIVFKLQTIRSTIEQYKQRLLDLKVHPSVLTEFETANEATRNEKYIKYGKGAEQITFKHWDESEKKIRKLKKHIIAPIKLLIIGMVVSTIGILATCFINKIFILELITLAAVIIFFFYTLFVIYNSIDRILG